MHEALSGRARSGVSTRLALLVLLLGTSLIVSTPACAQTPATFTSERHGFRVTTVVEGLSHPWGLAFLPNGDMLVTERAGRLRLVHNRQLDPRPIEGVPEVWANGQGGLLDVVLHPQFARNQFVYLSYS